MKPPAEDVLRFLNDLQLPRLRYLALADWSVDDAATQRLAANASLAALTRLDLEGCPIGPKGGAALLASPYLQRLVYLNLKLTRIGPAIEALTDRTVLPSLRECWLPRDVPFALQERLAAARGDIFL